MATIQEQYPEHARLVAIPEAERAAVRRFLEWLLAKPAGFYVRVGKGEPVDPDDLTDMTEADYFAQLVRVARHEFVRVSPVAVEDLLVAFYGLDAAKLAAEKAAMRAVVEVARRGAALVPVAPLTG